MSYLQTVIFGHGGAMQAIRKNVQKWPHGDVTPIFCAPFNDPVHLDTFNCIACGESAYDGIRLRDRWVESLQLVKERIEEWYPSVDEVLILEYDTIYNGDSGFTGPRRTYQESIQLTPGWCLTASYRHPIPEHRLANNYYSPWHFHRQDFDRLVKLAEETPFTPGLHDFTDYWMQDLIDKLGLLIIKDRAVTSGSNRLVLAASCIR